MIAEKYKRTMYSYIQGTILVTDFYKCNKASKLLRCHTIDTDSFLDDLKPSPLITRVGIVRGGGVEPPVHVYRRSFLSENRL